MCTDGGRQIQERCVLIKQQIGPFPREELPALAMTLDRLRRACGLVVACQFGQRGEGVQPSRPVRSIGIRRDVDLGGKSRAHESRFGRSSTNRRALTERAGSKICVGVVHSTSGRISQAFCTET